MPLLAPVDYVSLLCVSQLICWLWRVRDFVLSARFVYRLRAPDFTHDFLLAALAVLSILNEFFSFYFYCCVKYSQTDEIARVSRNLTYQHRAKAAVFKHQHLRLCKVLTAQSFK